jgi:hypothetical protein
MVKNYCLSAEEIENILTKLGFDFVKNGCWLTANCKVHGGDNTHGFSFNTQKMYWKCWTNKCHEKHGIRLHNLISAILGISEYEAKEWLEENASIKVRKTIKEVKTDKIYPEFCLKRLFRTDFYLKRGFLESTLENFEHGLAESGVMRGRVVFPIRDHNGFIRGFSGRWAGKQEDRNGKLVCLNRMGQNVPKWKHTSFTKSSYLYNFYKAKEHCTEQIILVESIGNVMRLWECGFKSVVACLGSSLSPELASTIISTTKRLILAFDADNAGFKATTKAKKMLDGYIDIKTISPTSGKDWAELNNQEVMEIWKKLT